jgi:hypothetical protein
MKKTLNVTRSGWNRLRLRQSVPRISEKEVLVRQHVPSGLHDTAIVTGTTCFGEGAAIHIGPFCCPRQTVQNPGEKTVEFPKAYRIVWVRGIDDLPQEGFGFGELFGVDVLPRPAVELFRGFVVVHHDYRRPANDRGVQRRAAARAKRGKPIGRCNTMLSRVRLAALGIH